ncbi:MAG: DUF6152 family protein [Pseudomonadota bacterium]
MSIHKLMIVSTGALVAGAILLSVPAAAHHSFAPYDDKNPVTIDGTLKEVRFTNPHVGLVVDSVKDGKQVTYSIHGRSTGDWRRDGWKPSDFKVGDKVNIIGFPRRDNGLEVAIKTFTRVSDGKYFGAPPAQK